MQRVMGLHVAKMSLKTPAAPSSPFDGHLYYGNQEHYGRNGGQGWDLFAACLISPPLPNLEFSFYLQNSLPADDFRVNESNFTCSINDNMIDIWREKLSEKDNPNSVKYVHGCRCFLKTHV